MQTDRRLKIAEMISEKGSVKVSDLVSIFGKSEMTIHRDLNFLETQGVLHKSRGGAVRNPSSTETNYSFRSNTCLIEKQQIAKVVCDMILDGDTIMIDGSTSAIEVAKQLKNIGKRITVFTHSPLIIYELMNSPSIILYSIGSFFSREMVHFIGPDVDEQIKALNFSKGIFGVSAIMEDMCLADPYPQLASIKARIIASSIESFALADYTKFGKVAVQRFAHVKDISFIVTDNKVDKGISKIVSESTKLIVAGC